jgi:molybdenum-dependent DNA-binding transcriptional regulator ModE
MFWGYYNLELYYNEAHRIASKRVVVKMNLELLRYFVAVADAGSISKAAEKVFISQQGLSKAIHSLEESLDIQLMVRTQHGITLTDDGRIFYKHAKTIQDEYSSAVLEMESRKQAVIHLNNERVKLTTSLVCIAAIINPMRDRGYLKKVVVHEAETGETLNIASNTGGLGLVDLPSHSYPVGSLDGEFVVIPLARTKMGVETRRSFMPDLPHIISAEQVSKLPLGVPDVPTTREICSYIFAEYPLQDVRLLTSSRNSLYSGMLNRQFAILSDLHQWKQSTMKFRHTEDEIVFSLIDSDLFCLFAFAYSKAISLTEEQEAFIESFVRVYQEIYPMA